jgi:hypothetical protein
MRLRPFLLALTAVLSLAACEKAKPQETPSALDVFPEIIMPPNASYVSKSGTKEALALLLRTTLKGDTAANFYRMALRPPAWRLVSDSKDNQGATLLYAEHSGRPLWVRVWPDTEFNATFIELTGAVQNLHPDSTSISEEGSAAGAPAATFRPMAPPKGPPGR